jgi:hypothetical protein
MKVLNAILMLSMMVGCVSANRNEVAMNVISANRSEGGMDAISGKTLNIIFSALPAFRSKGLDLNDYAVYIVEKEGSYIVVFDDPERKSSQRGSTKKLVSFQVEIGKETFEIIRSSYCK